MSNDYTSLVADLQNLCAESNPPSAGFTSILPATINSAEMRLYRELDLLSTVISDSTANATANSRSFTLPQANGRFVVTQQINIITPVGTTPSTGGTRNPLTPASKETIDVLWPSETALSSTTVPQLYAPLTDQIFRFGPAPGAAFNVEVIGTTRPAPLSATNPTTFLSLYLYDLLIAASMVFLSGWQMNFGAQGDDPKMAVAWEQEYAKHFASANLEEIRKKYGASGWQSHSVSNVPPSRSA